MSEKADWCDRAGAGPGRGRATLVRLALAMVAGALLPVAVVTGTAQAASSMSANAKDVAGAPPGGLSCADGRSIGVQVCFEPYGDKFWVRDYLADGHHVAASFSSENGEIGACHDYHSAAAGWTRCDQFSAHISEHQQMFFIGLVMEGSTILKQTGTAYAETT
jgi:hypothetical protein